MARMTLLELTQAVLSSMDSDEVNSITDTVESTQVAETIRDVYFELAANLSIPSKESLILLDGLADGDKPNYLRLPDNVTSIKWVKYDKGDHEYDDIPYCTPEEFFLKTLENSDGQEVEDFSGATLLIKSDEQPSFWTTFDNEYLVFNSYDSDVDSTLQSSKTLCWGQLALNFSFEDGFVPDLDSDMFPLLLAESKASCFVNFKQVANSKEEQKARRQRVRAQNDLWKANQRKPYDARNYGRRRP